jgi:hypothetical protein
MHKLGLSSKVSAVINPEEGYPKIIANARILQGEVLETVASHDVSFNQASILCDIADSFFHCIHPNPVKLVDANRQADALYKELVKEVLDGENPTPENIEKIKEDPRIVELFNNIKWMDVLIGHVPYYLESKFPNAEIRWNDSLKLWQIVALTEILQDDIITLLRKAD